jgi:PHD/YefM family antitoxin component YafN of YafNO toxin-antitoxin module
MNWQYWLERGSEMSRVVTFEELASNLTSIFEELQVTDEPVIVVRDGMPTAVISPVKNGEEKRLTVDELREELLQADANIEAGRYLEWEEVQRRLAGKLTEDADASESPR